MKIRTLSELQHRIVYLQNRLEKMMADPIASDDAKQIVKQFELSTIHNLQNQPRHRIALYFHCVSC